MLNHTLDSFVELVGGLNIFGRDAVGVGNHHEVRIDKRSFGVAFVVEQFLPLAHHAQEVVVEQNDFHIHIVLKNHSEFFDSHLQATVAGK